MNTPITGITIFGGKDDRQDMETYLRSKAKQDHRLKPPRRRLPGQAWNTLALPRGHELQGRLMDRPTFFAEGLFFGIFGFIDFMAKLFVALFVSGLLLGIIVGLLLA